MCRALRSVVVETCVEAWFAALGGAAEFCEYWDTRFAMVLDVAALGGLCRRSSLGLRKLRDEAADELCIEDAIRVRGRSFLATRRVD